MSNVMKIIAIAANSNTSAVSDDGDLWQRLGKPEEGQWVDGIHANNLHVAIHSYSRAAYSIDGVTWKETSLPSLEMIDYDDGTPDIPLTYTPRQNQPTWVSVAFGASKFVAIAERTKKYATSVDGINWTERQLPAGGRFSQIAWCNDKFIVVQRGSGIIYKSTDGISWTSQTIVPQIGDQIYPADFSSVGYGNGVYLITNNGHDTLVLRSTNATTWVGYWIDNDSIDSKLVYCNHEFVLFNNGRTQIQMSQDGTFEETFGKEYKDGDSWLPRDDESGLAWKNSPNFTSSDGILWKRAPTGLFANQVDAHYHGGRLIAVVPEKDTAFISEDSVKTETPDYFWQETTIDEVSGSKHINAGVGITSKKQLNQQEQGRGPSEHKMCRVSVTLVSRQKISDHDQADHYWNNSDHSTLIKPVRGITGAYRVISRSIIPVFSGSTTIQPVRRINGNTTIGFDWHKRPLPEISTWTSIWYGNGKWMALSGDEIVAESTNNGESWKTYLMPVRNTWNFSDGSATTYTYSIKNWRKPASTLAYSATNLLTWHGGVLPVKLEPCIIAVANNQNNLYASYNGAIFRTINL